MDRTFSVFVLSGLLTVQLLATASGAGAEQSANPQLALDTESASVKALPLPAAPQGRSTIIGGEIQKLDPVRDQFELKAFGQRPMTILFDERTQLYLDGKMIPLRELRSESVASIQTVLDGTNVFAISIHMLSRAPEGEYQGQVLSYNADTRELTVREGSSRETIRLIVPGNTPIIRVGQADRLPVHPELSSLVNGTLVSLTFEPSKAGQGITSRIEILATPGSSFVFGGSLSSLDMHAGLMTVIDPRDEKAYQILFDTSKFPISETLHEGDNVRVAATFDGSRYVANSIASN
jgi:hypothetical protein